VFGPVVFGVAIALSGRWAIAYGTALTSPRLRGEVGICALSAQIPGEGASPQALSRKSELAGRPPHPDPLHSPSKMGVNALMASGEREHGVAAPNAIGLPKGRGEYMQLHAACYADQLIPADRILLAFALPPLVVVTVTASLVHAYANWAATAFIPLAILAAAILTRRNLIVLLWGSLALGIGAQIALIGADAFATHIRLPFLAKPNPYYRTLGWSAYGRTVGQLARKLGISAIASDTRAEVASLLYYWRDQREQILAWPTTEDLPGFDLTRGLTALAPQPVLFVSQCQDTDRLEQFYAKVMRLGIFATDDPAPRGFAAFTLEEPRGPIGPLAPCRTG